LSVNDTREIRYHGISPQSHALRTPVKSLKVVMGGACVVQTSGYLFERKSDSAEDLKSRRYALLGVSARNTQYVERMRVSVDLVFISEANSLQRSRVASARSSRDRDSLHTTLKKGRGFLSGMNTGVSAAKEIDEDQIQKP
jgi:hypothetical protein